MMIFVVLAMVAGLCLTPLGAPGNWIMLAALGLATWYRHVSVPVFVACIVVAAVAEVLEFVLVKKMAEKHGGSRRAFWGAIAGGILGVIAGVPVPIIGSVIGGFIGSFIGAAIATYMEARDMGEAGRVGWGAMMGRMWAAVIKTAVGIVILVAGVAALLF